MEWLDYCIVMGICLLVGFSGYLIFKGNIDLLHFHNRFFVLEQNIPEYSKRLGTGIMCIGLGTCFFAIISFLLDCEIVMLGSLLPIGFGVAYCYITIFQYISFWIHKKK